jgi:predicted dienelactone hydrolase
MNVFQAAASLTCIIMPIAAAAQTAGPQAPAAATTVEQVMIGAPGEQMPLVIWRPAGAAEAGTRFSLVIISHGTGGGPLGHVDTAEALRAAGFVVAAPMHRGDNFQDEKFVGRPEWMASRSRDVSTSIDYMLQEWSGRAQLDPKRVGIFGFSAGGTTALIAAGAVPDLGRLAPHCAVQREFVCTIMAAQFGTDTSPPRWTHDPRIAAAVVAAPGLGFLFEPAGLAGVRVPVQLWSGSADDTVPYASNAAVVRRLLPSSPDFHSVEGAVHLSFLAPCTAETPPMLCRDRDGFDRAAFHRSFNEAVSAFFRRHLSLSSRHAGGGK